MCAESYVAVAQMDLVTQQNAAQVEQASAAAEAMEQQAAQMLKSVSVFKLAGAVAVAAPQARASAIAASAQRLALR